MLYFVACVAIVMAASKAENGISEEKGGEIRVDAAESMTSQPPQSEEAAEMEPCLEEVPKTSPPKSLPRSLSKLQRAQANWKRIQE